MWKRNLKKFVKNSQGKILFLINIRQNIPNVLQIFKNILKDSPCPHLIIFFNQRTPPLPMDFLNIEVSEPYLSQKDYETIDHTVFKKISTQWYRASDSMSYHQISLGQMMEYDFQKFLIPRIKNFAIIQKILTQQPIDGTKYQPEPEGLPIERIVVLDDTNELTEVIQYYANYHKLSLFNLSSRHFPLNHLTGWFTSLRKTASDLFSNLLDRSMLKLLIKKKSLSDTILIDFKLYSSFQKRCDFARVIPCLLEKGFKIRFRLRQQKDLYLPLLISSSCPYLKNRKMYKNLWKQFSHDENFKNLFVYNNDPIWEFIQKELSKYFLKDFPRMVGNIQLLEKIFQKKNIKLVVLRNDIKELEKTLIMVSRRADIPSLVIQHGILAEHNGHHLLLADKIAVWGNASIDWYQKYGNSSDRIVVTGNHKFDTLNDWKPSFTREGLCKNLHLDHQKPILLLVTQQINKFSSFWTDDLFHFTAEEILKSIKQDNLNQLIIKADPYENVVPYQKIILRTNAVGIAIRNMAIYELLFHSDLVITLDSTVALEAMFFDKPIITFNLTQRKDRVAYAQTGAALAVYDSKDLTDAIKKGLGDSNLKDALRKAQKIFMKEYAYALDGKSHERILSLMSKTCRI